MTRFQSTPPHGGRHRSHRGWQGSCCFNPRPRTGGDVHSVVCVARGLSFNPRPRTGGDTLRSQTPTLPACFNPRPRTGGDMSFSLCSSGNFVSIHAPARGATARNQAVGSLFLSFNPRPRTGGDGGSRVDEVTAPEVSIHAPARGATRALVTDRHDMTFQSTPPHGGRPSRVAGTIAFIRGFNPRPRTGGDMDRDDFWDWLDEVSIHAPARGATFCDSVIDTLRYVSIHAPARGATERLMGEMAVQKFQSTPPHGGRLFCPSAGRPRRDPGVSIHAPARGATPRRD